MLETLRIGAIVLLVVVGLFFTFVSATGVLRLPDVYSRAHTASQADTLGAGFALAGVALALGWGTTSYKTVLLLFFIFITNPTAAHAISRAADEQGIEPWTTDDDRTDADLYEEADMKTDGGKPLSAVDGQTDDARPVSTVDSQTDDARPVSTVDSQTDDAQSLSTASADASGEHGGDAE